LQQTSSSKRSVVKLRCIALASRTSNEISDDMSTASRSARVEPSRDCDHSQDPYKVYVSVRFLVVSLGCSVLAAFAVGRAARIILLEGPRNALFAAHDDSSMFDRPDYHEGYETRRAKTLPPPRIQAGKQVPHTVDTAKNFDTARSVTSSSLLVRPNEDSGTNGAQVCEEPRESDEGEHLPAGQHLLVDIEGVDGSFLNSEERLAFAMMEVVNQANLTLLSYHCHSMVPTGVSCVGVLLESHVSFHTWPGQGVITLDLFTCGSNPLLPVVPIIERLFGVPRPGAPHPPHTIWSHKLRGFRPGSSSSSPLQSYDLGTAILGVMTADYKQEVRVC
jgi:S-adenosylmethionine decarboxylase proenzyme